MNNDAGLNIEQSSVERQARIASSVASIERTNQSLQRTTGQLTNATDLQRFLADLLYEALQLLAADRGHLFILDQDRELFSYAAGANVDGAYLEPESDEPAIFRGSFSIHLFPVFQLLLNSRRVAILSESANDAPLPVELQDWFESSGMVDAVGLALWAGTEPVGFIGLMFSRKPDLTFEQLEFFQAMANHGALGIRMARLSEQAGRTAVAEERTRLAREIHDTLGQVFAGISLQLEAAKRVLVLNPTKAMDCMSDALSLARSGLAEVRRSVWAMRPIDLDGGDLASALARLVKRAQRDTPVRIDFEVKGETAIIPAHLEDELLRIAQEALSNSLRHARPNVVTISLSYSSNLVTLTVSDDGSGFDVNANADRIGFGIISMHERASRVGERLQIESTPDAGTHVSISVST